MTMPPIITLELEGIKHSVRKCIMNTEIETDKAFNAAVDHAINSFDFQGEVTRATHKAISDAVNSHFSYGEGYKTIRDTVDKAMKQLFKTKK